VPVIHIIFQESVKKFLVFKVVIFQDMVHLGILLNLKSNHYCLLSRVCILILDKPINKLVSQEAHLISLEPVLSVFDIETASCLLHDFVNIFLRFFRIFFHLIT
jgi:hypothetical protein